MEFLACQVSPVVAAVTVAVSVDPFVALSPAKAAGATLRTVAESAASAAASSVCISVFRTITLALPSAPGWLCPCLGRLGRHNMRLDGCARVSGPP